MKHEIIDITPDNRGMRGSNVKTMDPAQSVDNIRMLNEHQGQIPLDRAMSAHAEQFGQEDVQAETVINMAKVFPKEDIDDEEPVKERAVLMAGLMMRHSMEEPETFKQALSTVLKQRRLMGHMDKYDQTASGRNSDALDAIAGARNGAVPARFIFRLKHSTKIERWWTTFGHDENIKNFTRRLRPGPKIQVEDISYWMVIRNAWQSMRPENGKLLVTVHADIPTDAHPEQVMGDGYNVFQGLPQQRIGESGKQMIQTDADLLFCCLGYRSGKRGLLPGEWIVHARSSVQSQAKPTKIKIKGEDKEGFAEESKFQGLFSVLKIVGTLGGGIILFFLALAIYDFLMA